MLSFFVWLLPLWNTLAQEGSFHPNEVELDSARGPQHPVELEIFFDGLFPALLEAYHIPGAVVVMVKDDSLFFAKGYGYADLENQILVDPATTLFRIGSVSKLMTATAVMQQVEQGKLALDTNVNDYLSGFKIREAFDKPVTLFNLLTHTPGFDDTYSGFTEPLTTVPTPLREYLARRQPARVIPPGEVISYSNYGLALAGHLVEIASGQPFDTYAREHIFSPLGMDNTRFGIPAMVPASMAHGYAWINGRHAALGFDRLLPAPAGDVITTGLDMARFMITYLHLGELEGQRIVQEASAQEMLTQQFTHHPELMGWGLGFYPNLYNKVPVWGHNGSWRGFGTMLMLIPDSGLGVFVSTNLEYSSGFFRNFGKQFFDRYYPNLQEKKLDPPSDFAARTAPLLGNYQPTRRVRASMMKSGSLQGTMRLWLAKDGALVLGGGGSPPRRFIEVAPMLLAEEDGDARMAFRTDDNGTVQYLFVDGWSLEPVPWYSVSWLHQTLLGIIAAFFSLSVLGWLLGWLSRRLAKGSLSLVLPAARWTAFTVCLLQATFLISLFVLLSNADQYELMRYLPAYLAALLVLPLISLVLTLVLPYFLVRGFTRDAQAPLAKLHYWSLVVLAFLALGIEWYWNLLGFYY